MDAQRAKEIAESGEMIDVFYYDVPVYIQHVNMGAGTARIFPLENPDKEQTVPVEALTEERSEPDIPFV
jgi:small acid-soluble spore protein H (minor)